MFEEVFEEVLNRARGLIEDLSMIWQEKCVRSVLSLVDIPHAG